MIKICGVFSRSDRNEGTYDVTNDEDLRYVSRLVINEKSLFRPRLTTTLSPSFGKTALWPAPDPSAAARTPKRQKHELMVQVLITGGAVRRVQAERAWQSLDGRSDAAAGRWLIWLFVVRFVRFEVDHGMHFLRCPPVEEQMLV